MFSFNLYNFKYRLFKKKVIFWYALSYERPASNDTNFIEFINSCFISNKMLIQHLLFWWIQSLFTVNTFVEFIKRTDSFVWTTIVFFFSAAS